jgi:hypothetical protein
MLGADVVGVWASISRHRDGILAQLDRGGNPTINPYINPGGEKNHPGAVTRLAVLDIVPTHYLQSNVTRAMATAYWHWFFLAAGDGIPEHVLTADPGYWVRTVVRRAPWRGRGHRARGDGGLCPLLRRPGNDSRLVLTTARPRGSTWRTMRKAPPPGRRANARSWRCGESILLPVAATIRSASGSSTHPTSAARRCRSAISCPEKHRTSSPSPTRLLRPGPVRDIHPGVPGLQAAGQALAAGARTRVPARDVHGRDEPPGTRS